MRQLTLTFIVIPFCLFHSSTVTARDWARYTSENFTIYSDVRQGRVSDLLEELETFRELIFMVVGLEKAPVNDNLQILMFSSSREYRRIAPENTAGIFTSTTAGPRMVIGSSRGSIQRNRVLFHEYIHYLLRENSEVNFPRWFDEGYAEVMSTVSIHKSFARLGEIPEDRTYAITSREPFKVRDLIDPNFGYSSAEYVSRFYSYAWLFTHYLQFSAFRGEPELLDAKNDYLQRIYQGEHPVTAFESSFHMTPEDMDAVLASYAQSRRLLAVSVDIEKYQGDFQKEELSPGEQSFLLADLAWRIGEEEIALEYLENLDQSNSSFARSLSLAAVLENHTENTELATTYAGRALEMAPDDPKVLTNLSHWKWDVFNGESETMNNSNQQQLESSIEFARLAIQEDPSSLEAHRFLWQGQIAKQENIEALRTMMSAYQLQPSDININYQAGMFLVQLGRLDLARPFLERVRNWTHSTELRNEIITLLETSE